MGETTGERDGIPSKGAQDKTGKVDPTDRNSAIWIRPDGAICVGNECITFKKSPSGAMDFTLDPDKCECEERDALLSAFADCIIGGEGINLAIKPRTKQTGG